VCSISLLDWQWCSCQCASYGSQYHHSGIRGSDRQPTRQAHVSYSTHCDQHDPYRLLYVVTASSSLLFSSNRLHNRSIPIWRFYIPYHYLFAGMRHPRAHTLSVSLSVCLSLWFCLISLLRSHCHMSSKFHRSMLLRSCRSCSTRLSFRSFCQSMSMRLSWRKSTNCVR
jgi:hypothetical protein